MMWYRYDSAEIRIETRTKNMKNPHTKKTEMKQFFLCWHPDRLSAFFYLVELATVHILRLLNMLIYLCALTM